MAFVRKKFFWTYLAIIFWNFWIFLQFFQSLLLKRSLIVSKKGHPPSCQMKLLKQTTTTNHHKPTANDHKLPQTTNERPQTTTNHQQTTTNYHQTNTNYQQSTTNDHLCTKNQKFDVSFLLPAPGNHKEHPHFEKHTLHSAK